MSFLWTINYGYNDNDETKVQRGLDKKKETTTFMLLNVFDGDDDDIDNNQLD